MDFSSIHELQFGGTQVYLLGYKPFDIHSYLHYLTEIETLKLGSILHPVKKMEFVAIRMVKKEVFGEVDIFYNALGAPNIRDSVKHISISHTKNMVGLAVADYCVGFDLEPIGYKAKKLHQKFLTETECNLLNCNSEVEMTKAWSAKEALYKVAGRKGIHFKGELILEPQEENVWLGKVKNDDHMIEVPLHFATSDDNILTVNPKELIQYGL